MRAPTSAEDNAATEAIFGRYDAELTKVQALHAMLLRNETLAQLKRWQKAHAPSWTVFCQHGNGYFNLGVSKGAVRLVIFWIDGDEHHLGYSNTDRKATKRHAMQWRVRPSPAFDKLLEIARRLAYSELVFRWDPFEIPPQPRKRK